MISSSTTRNKRMVLAVDTQTYMWQLGAEGELTHPERGGLWGDRNVNACLGTWNRSAFLSSCGFVSFLAHGSCRGPAHTKEAHSG
jgi:hypothetical protein